MNPSLHRTLLPALFLLLAACGLGRPRLSSDAWRRDPVKPRRYWSPPLRCTITAPPVVRLGERIVARFTLKNVGQDWLHFTYWETPLAGMPSHLYGIYRDGEGIGYRGIFTDYVMGGPHTCEERGCHMREAEFIELSTSESVSAGLDLADSGYHLDRPGLYEISYSGGLHYADEGKIPPFDTHPSLRSKPHRLRHATLQCQSAIVLVVAADAASAPGQAAP